MQLDREARAVVWTATFFVMISAGGAIALNVYRVPLVPGLIGIGFFALMAIICAIHAVRLHYGRGVIEKPKFEIELASTRTLQETVEDHVAGINRYLGELGLARSSVIGAPPTLGPFEARDGSTHGRPNGELIAVLRKFSTTDYAHRIRVSEMSMPPSTQDEIRGRVNTLFDWGYLTRLPDNTPRADHEYSIEPKGRTYLEGLKRLRF